MVETSPGSSAKPLLHELRATLGAGPDVFNLGHGILPETPPEHVAELACPLNEPPRRD